MQTTAIILAGGKSKRMGCDKALLKLDGTTLLDKAIELCKPFCSEIIISSNNTKHKKLGCHVIADEVKNCGPMAGILSCLKQSKTDWNIVISVDAAFLETDFLKYFLTEIAEFDAVVPYSENGIEPLIALYNKSCQTKILELLKAGDFKMKSLINSVCTKHVDAQLWIQKYPNLFRNLNHPNDL